MAEKRNLVIKVKYPTGAASKGIPLNANVITVWNVQRIGLAAGALLVFVLLVVFAFSGDDSGPVSVAAKAQPNQERQVASKTQAKAAILPTLAASGRVSPETKTASAKLPIAAQPVAGTQTHALSKEPPRVRRALLTTHITDKEPANEIIQSVNVQPAKLTTVYYFNELRGMNGNILYHEWSRNGVSVAKEPLQVSADRWRVSSHKTFDDQGGGNWTVKLLDGTGNVLNEKSFAVHVGQ